MNQLWERALRVDEPVVTKPFLMLAALVAIGLTLSAVREFVGLGAVTGLNDGYTWGLFKNFNVTTLTALGSAGYAVGVLTWLLNRRRYHVLLRTSALISILSYTTAILALGVDLGRPWNFYNMLNPATWNRYSLLLEVAICMTAYLLLGLQAENIPAFVERVTRLNIPRWLKAVMEKILDTLRRTYPFMISLAFILPSMHQSSLGGLMMLAGPRVHPLWQSPMLPVLYLIMAYTLGFAAIIGILMVSCLLYKRPLDMRILSRLGHITGIVALVFMALQLGDLAGRGELGRVVAFDFHSRLFLIETALILVPAVLLQIRKHRERAGNLYFILVILTIGGLMYRFVPTTVAFLPGDHYRYFPTIPEMLISGGFVALAMIGYLYTVKRYNILPVPLAYWFKADEGNLITPVHSAGGEE